MKLIIKQFFTQLITKIIRILSYNKYPKKKDIKAQLKLTKLHLNMKNLLKTGKKALTAFKKNTAKQLIKN